MGWQQVISVQAEQVIVFGSSGVFVYHGSITEGNLIESHTDVSFTGPGPAGEAIVGGDTVYTIQGGTAYAIQRTGFIIMDVYSASSQLGPYSIITGWQIGISTAGSSYEVKVSVPGGNSVIVSTLNTEVTGPFNSTGGTASNPTLITTDSWNAMTLSSPFSAGTPAPEYRLYPDNTVHLKGQVSLIANAAAFSAFQQLPAGYIPAEIQHFTTPNTLSGFGLGDTSVEVNTVGNCQTTVAGVTGNVIYLDGIVISLD
jgi:hypothetical protein